MGTKPGHASILVVDSDRSSRLAISTGLRRMGYDTIEAESGHAALILKSRGEFDAIMVNARMPQMDGIELLSQLRLRSKDDVVILMGTAQELTPLIRSTARDMGVSGFLTKPLHMTDLSRVIEEALEQASEASPDDLSAGDGDASGEAYSILVVDDDEAIREGICEWLGLHGHDVVAACDGYEALACQSQRRFDAMILDMKMPGLTGLGVLRQMGTDHPNPAVIILTAVPDPVGTLESEARKMGAHSVLRKPIRMADLAPTLRLAIEQARKDGATQQAADAKHDESPQNEAGAEEAARETTDPTSEETGGDPECKRSILVVDDEQPVRDAIAEGLANEGYHVVSAPNGHEALRCVDRETVDAIVLDIRMPEITGMEVLRQLRGEHPDTVVIMLTGMEDQEGTMESEALELGARDFLKKPVRLAELDRRLHEALAGESGTRDVTRGAQTPSSEATPAKYAILVVDDEKSVREAIARGLNRRGYDVATARNGREALFYRSQEKFDAMILDIRMPEITGLEVLQQLRQSYPDAVVLMLTAVADPDHDIETAAIEMGAHAFLTKPIRLLELERVLREVLQLSVSAQTS